MKKRFLSVLVCLIMVLCLLPMAALAEGGTTPVSSRKDPITLGTDFNGDWIYGGELVIRKTFRGLSKEAYSEVVTNLRFVITDKNGYTPIDSSWRRDICSPRESPSSTASMSARVCPCRVSSPKASSIPR